jgi:lysophospholipase L1-like esterase
VHGSVGDADTLHAVFLICRLQSTWRQAPATCVGLSAPGSRLIWVRAGSTAAFLLALVQLSGCSNPAAPTPGPTVSCPALQTAESPDARPVVVHFGAVTVTSGKPPVTLACAPPDGSAFPVGMTTVTCTATDAIRQSSSCTFSVTVTTPPLLTVTRFGAFGDSITWGEDGTVRTTSNLRPTVIRPAVQVPIPQTYPGALQQLLLSRYTRQSPRVDNLGLPGEEASYPTAVARFSTTITNGGYDVVLLMEGSNDVNAMVKDLAVEPVAIGNLRQMLDLAKSKGVRPYLATIPPMNPGGTRGIGAGLVPEFNNELAGLAASEQVPLVGIYQALATDIGTNIGPDGLHPTVAGYAKIADTFFSSIKQTLETSPTTTASTQSTPRRH